MSESPRVEPGIVVCVCQGCLSEKLRSRGEIQDGELRFQLLTMPCSSKLEVPHVLQILERGVEGVQVVGCPVNACRFLVGSQLMEKRVARAQRLLDEIGLGGARLAVFRGTGLTVEDLCRLARRLAQAVAPLGPNPMRGAAKSP